MTYSSRTRLHPYANGYFNPYVLPRPLAPGVPPLPPSGAREWTAGDRNRTAINPGLPSTSRVGMVSFWINMPNTIPNDGSAENMLSLWAGPSNNNIVQVARNGSDGQRLTVTVNDGTLPIMDIAIGQLAINTWHHFIGTWDNTFPANSAAHIKAYINGTIVQNGVNGGTLLQQGISDVDIPYNNVVEVTQGSNNSSLDGFPTLRNLFQGCLSEFYLNTAELLDIDILANREAFRNASGEATFLGLDGSLPTGSPPSYYASNGELKPNAGTAPDVTPTVTGVITNCADAPVKAGPIYISSARDYDGATKNRISGLPSGVTDGRVGTFSCWVKLHDIVSQQTLIHYSQIPAGAQGGLCRFAVGTQGMKLILNLFNTSAQTGLTMGHQGGMLLNTWHHVMYSWDNAFPVDAANNLTGYFDGAVVVDGVGGANMSQSNSDFDLAYATKGTEYTEGQRSSNFDGFQPNHLDGCVSNLYFNIDERIDLTVLANREKFRLGAAGQANGLPVYLGADGSLPSGSQPAFYAENGELVANAGYASNLPVIQGAVTDCADAPS